MNKSALSVAALAVLLTFFSTTCNAASARVEPVLSAGDNVQVHYENEGAVQYVVGSVHIDQPVDRVWQIVANPYEFENGISPRFHTLAVLKDEPNLSVLRCRVDLGFLFPAINYTVESRYERGHRINFHSRSGDLKDFRGSWTISPSRNGRSCDVTYALHVVPGIPLPGWLVREAVKHELPQVLAGLKERVEQVCGQHASPAHRTIAAAAAIQTM